MTVIARAPAADPIDADLADLFGVRYVAPGTTEVLEARSTNLYHYRAYVGAQTITVEAGDCCYWVGDTPDRRVSVEDQRGSRVVISRR
jgi:hypothetical protein